MRRTALIATLLTLAACATVEDKSYPFAQANSLMRREIQSRIANIPYQHRQELLNNLIWLVTRGGETAITDLLTALENEDAKVRSSSAWVLGRLMDRRVIPQLRPLVNDENRSVRFEAARSLMVMGDLEHATLLIEGLDSDRIPVRYNCHMALRDSTGRDFQYDHLEEEPAERRLAVLRWREWWAEQTADPFFAQKYAEKHGIGSAAGGPGQQTPGSELAKPLTETRPGTENPAPDRPDNGKTDTDKVFQDTGEGPFADPKPTKKGDTAVSPNLNALKAWPLQTKTGTKPAPRVETKPVPKPEPKADDGQIEPWIDRILDKIDSKAVPKPVEGTKAGSKTEAKTATKSGEKKQ